VKAFAPCSKCGDLTEALVCLRCTRTREAADALMAALAEGTIVARGGGLVRVEVEKRAT
jgi:hypothetical protein